MGSGGLVLAPVRKFRISVRTEVRVGRSRTRATKDLVYNRPILGGKAPKFLSSFSYPVNLYRWRSIADEVGNGWRLPPPPYDAGGPLNSVDYDVDTSLLQELIIPTTAGLYQGRWYDGPVMPKTRTWDPTNGTTLTNFWRPQTNVSDSVLESMGTTAVARANPGDPNAGLFTAIGELRRDGIPAVTGALAFKGRGKPSSLGSEYLNYEFGWKPLVSDIRKLAASVSESEKILEQYRRNVGRDVRRTYRFPRIEDTQTYSTYGVNHTPSLDVYYFDGTYQSTYLRTTRTSVDRWFSGAFTSRPISSDRSLAQLESTIREANHLFGVLPTPSALWDLTPWTWAFDWFANMGDVLSNASAAVVDGQVLRYGYIMEKSVTIVDHSISGPIFKKVGVRMDSTVRCRTTRKRRRKANPFGFGITNDSLTERQFAILAALGFSQGGSRIGM